MKFSKSNLKKNDYTCHSNCPPKVKAEACKIEPAKIAPGDPGSNKYSQRQKGNGKFKNRSRHFSNKTNKLLKNDKDENPADCEVKAKQQTEFLRQMLKLSDSQENGTNIVRNHHKLWLEETQKSARKPPLLPTPSKTSPFGFRKTDFPELKSHTEQYLTYNFCKVPENQSHKKDN